MMLLLPWLYGLVACTTSTIFAPNVSQSNITGGPINITSGGYYSGNWYSDDPNVPAITISTDQPVTIHDSVISGRGDLIHATGGVQLQLQNVKGIGIDPGLPGKQRGKFLYATGISSLIAKKISVSGVSFGFWISSSTVSKLQIQETMATDLEDRASDGSGKLANVRPRVGHFIILVSVSAPNGADISWNQLKQTIGNSSTEDVINIFESQGANGNPIRVHDNFLEGFSSPASPSDYSGAGVITDGPGSNGGVTAFVFIDNNQIVHTAGGGIAIAAGHDITVRDNTVVSCGLDGSGKWISMPFTNAFYLWDYYRTGITNFFNNTIIKNSGGLVRPNAENAPVIADLWASSPEVQNPGMSIAPNNFTDPCISNGEIHSEAEDAERTRWNTKINQNQHQIGAQM